MSYPDDSCSGVMPLVRTRKVLSGELPTPPRVDRWPQAIKSAELLHGSLVRCGPGVRLAAWPESPRIRAFALAPWLAPQRVAVLSSAAWVWGAARTPGKPLEFSTRDNRRAERVTQPDYRLHQFRHNEEDLQHYGDFAVTLPLRTICDLLREPTPSDAQHRSVCRLLLRLVPGGTEAVHKRVLEGARPYREISLRRLELL
jgi:hypothetical protein